MYIYVDYSVFTGWITTGLLSVLQHTAEPGGGVAWGVPHPTGLGQGLAG